MDSPQPAEGIYLADCLDGMAGIQPKTVKLIVADGPYFQGMTHNGAKAEFHDLAMVRPFIREMAQQFKRILSAQGEFYFCTDWRGYALYYPELSSVLDVRNLIVWDKGSGPGSYYAFQHELIIYGSMDPKIYKKGSNVWRIPGFSAGAKQTDGAKLLSTQKPLQLIERMVSESSAPGDLVVDPFCGSGTTAEASIKLGRRIIAFEVSAANFDICRRRLERGFTNYLPIR